MLWKLLSACVQIPWVRPEAMREDRQSRRLSVDLTNCTSLTKADLSPAPVECSNRGQHKPTLRPQHGFIPQRDWLATWWQGNFLQLFPI